MSKKDIISNEKLTSDHGELAINIKGDTNK